MSSKKTTTTNQTQSNALNPQYSNLVYGNVDQTKAEFTPYQPYAGDLVAGFTPAQIQAQGELSGIDQNNVGASTLASGINAVQNAAHYQPLNVGAPNVTAAQIDPNEVSMVTPKNLTDVDLSGYLNPYLHQVADTTAADSQHQLEVQQNYDNAQATKAGAWRGTANAVQQAIDQSNSNRSLQSTLAGIYSGGFNQATGNAETDLARAQQAAEANQGAQLSIAGTNVGNRQQAGIVNASNSLAGQEANQSAGLSAAQLAEQSGVNLAGMSQQELEQAVRRAGLTEAVGASQQAQNQAALNWAYQNGYLNKQQYTMAWQQLLNQSVGLVPPQETTNLKGKTTESTSDPLKAIGAIASLVAAPFTGGASLAGLGGLFGGGQTSSDPLMSMIMGSSGANSAITMAPVI